VGGKWGKDKDGAEMHIFPPGEKSIQQKKRGEKEEKISQERSGNPWGGKQLETETSQNGLPKRKSNVGRQKPKGPRHRSEGSGVGRIEGQQNEGWNAPLGKRTGEKKNEKVPIALP